MSNIRKLKPDEIDVRVSQVTANGVVLLLYKTARVDRAILDETFGDNWQNDFKLIDGKLFGGIGVYNKELDQWLWRWDCGTESNTEKEKGQASDCFKRAGFKWGIGIELYSAPFIFAKVETELNEQKKYQLKNKFVKFKVKSISYSENGTISKLEITDDKENTVYNSGKVIKSTTSKAKPEPIPPEDVDIHEGLKAMDTSKNAYAYYLEQKDCVKNLEAFKQAYTIRYKELKKKEGQNG